MPQLALQAWLEQHQARYPVSRWVVAYSGGVDSHVLLHALASLNLSTPIAAFHAHHGLQAEADSWQSHCEEICAALSLPLQTYALALSPAPGESVEAVAREARYQRLGEALEPGDVLLTAHHQDDQAETLFLQLCRGAGPDGLAGIAPLRPLAKGFLARPLLSVPKEAFLTYAKRHALQWCEDGSNQSLEYDRNFVRSVLMPMIKTRFPGVGKSFSRTAQLCQQSRTCLQELAARDIEAPAGSVLPFSPLTGLSEARQANAIRYWLNTQGYRMPTQARLLEFLRQIATAAPDKSPALCWEEARVRLWQQKLFLDTGEEVEQLTPFAWDGQTPIEYRSGAWLSVEACLESEIFLPESGKISVRFWGDGAGELPKKRLQVAFAAAGVPPWERSLIPLLFCEGEYLGAVGGIVRPVCV